MNPFKEERPTYLLGLVRVAMSVLVLCHVYRMARELLRAIDGIEVRPAFG